MEADLADLTYRGPKFTWTNKSKSNLIAKKLDRVLVNDEWLSYLPTSFATFGEPDFSDHAVGCATFLQGAVRIRRPFRFQNFLLQNALFLDFLTEQWFSINVSGSAMFRISQKLKLLKNGVRSFAKENYSNLEKRVQEAHCTLLSAQNLLLLYPTERNAISEASAFGSWSVLAKAEESFLLQRSHINWSKEGDCGSAYFHRLIATRRSINHIHFLLDESGTRIEGQKAIQSHCVDYFKGLMGADQPPPMFEQQDLSLLLPFRCSDSQKNGLIRPFTRQEIKEEFFLLPSNKTSGPDGYSVEFFTGAWSVVGAEATDAVLEFFQSGKLLKQ